MCEDGRGEIYKERHLKLKPDVCVSVFLCVCVEMQCLFQDCRQCHFLASDFFLRVCGLEEECLVQLKERIK